MRLLGHSTTGKHVTEHHTLVPHRSRMQTLPDPMLPDAADLMSGAHESGSLSMAVRLSKLEPVRSSLLYPKLSENRPLIELIA